MDNAAFQRRGFLKGALSVAAIASVGGLSACAAGGSGGGGGGSAETGDVTEDNPFGLGENTEVEAVIFNGGYGVDYCVFAGEVVTKKFPTVKVTVTPSTQIAQELQPRFVGGNPPDVIDNSGAGAMSTAQILDQLADVSDILEANNYEGTKIADTLYPGVIEAGTYGDKFVQLNYVMAAYGIWYSDSLFKENGWTAPKTWAEALELSAAAKEAGKYLFLFGKEAATYYNTLCIDSAIMEGGQEVRLNLENLKPGAWSQEPLQEAFNGLKAIIDAGGMKPGGSGTQFTNAQAQWSDGQEALLYPSGSWIENEMADATADGFDMTVAPTPTVSDSPAAGDALHASPGEGFILPAKAANPAGAKEFMRAMLSKEAATNFAQLTKSPTIVMDTVPEDGFGSKALQGLNAMLSAAGDQVYPLRFSAYYGLNTDQLVLWNDFLEGRMDVPTLTEGLQGIADAKANDPNVEKIEFE
ncbi:N-acetylglucosamine/diacetylchitobiose ABC transporter substrate-binding protein [Parenemella sanctibonifatiensis]|uniref:Carbohydrate ABC transporter, N-acetylglucosamine/diacetylchitobiose-binding protein n=1 Tax=Parenemella sanctibonifatiensis TaxID=2016505 RepID=A0A255ED23_9ACTN|nr:N-acetylglucosamine/diacetylchitobiose ABC transporter substrate-binding protein [Parenemella sanctibonifatiensis]OYN89459.1 carbohydrate ABC transporter, N-acetylglucosamine/diacetylchitobiose-binding protein [Parenemella sanctibonifatiensis]